LDVLPTADLGLRVGVQRLYGLRKPPKPARLEQVARPWQPYRTIATWYLWRSLGGVPQSGGVRRAGCTREGAGVGFLGSRPPREAGAKRETGSRDGGEGLGLPALCRGPVRG